MRRLLVIVLALLAAVPQAGAAERALWPGVTYESGVQLTPNGPVAIGVLYGPRPGGLTTLEPVLSNETLLGTETLTAMQRRLAPVATTAGINGDFFAPATGRPSGVLMREGQLLSSPAPGRVSAGITTDGTLDVRRVTLSGTWRGTGAARALHRLNEAPPANGAALYTQAFGTATPRIQGRAAVAVLFPFPTATPNVDLVAPVVELRPGGAPAAIPTGGAVLLARGASADALLGEAPAGAAVTARLTLRPGWDGIVAAIGGGPQIVRDGVPVFRAGEEFTSRQLAPRAPRSAVGQLRDGRIVLVAVDGRRPGWSVGLTNFELAQTLVRLGAVTGMALDGGGSTAMAFDGVLLSRPSGARERPIATALMLAYTGVFSPEAPAVVSPNGDGVAEAPELSYRVVRPSTVTLTLRAPDGSAALSSTAAQPPGAYPVAFPPAATPPPAPAAPEAGVAAEAPPAAPAALGRWTLEVSAVDDLGRQSSISRSFVVDDTLGHLVVPRRLSVTSTGGELPIRWTLAREAQVGVSVLDSAGRVVRALTTGRYPAGERSATWDGRARGRRVVPAGTYVVRVTAVGPVGRSELSADVVVRRAAVPRR